MVGWVVKKFEGRQNFYGVVGWFTNFEGGLRYQKCIIEDPVDWIFT